MIDNIVVTAYGRPAGLELGAAVSAAKADGPLQPVTVVVGSNFAGLGARRLLGSGELGPRGVANVGFVTPFRLAEMLAVGQMAGRRPLTNPILGAAVRKALTEDPMQFREVAGHHATESALAALAGELANVSEPALARIEAAGGSGASSVQFYRSIKSHIGQFHNELDVAVAAARRADLPQALEQFGHLIWYLPSRLSRPLAQLLDAVFQAASATVIVGLSGVDDADEPTWEACAAAGVKRPSFDTNAIISSVSADSIVSVTDADEEVRAVIRRVAALADKGVPLDRIGVFFATPDPYVRILEQQFAASGLPCNGPSRRSLGESVAGQTLLRALSLPADRWRRDKVMALANAGPLRYGGESVSPAAWETLSRKAGVVQGLSDWKAKLEVHQKGLSSQREVAASDEQDWRVARIDRDEAALEKLGSFVGSMATHMVAIDAASSWTQKSEAAASMLIALLGAAGTHSGWPEVEQVAFERVEAALERLATLDEIEQAPSKTVFVRALTSELEVARGRNGRFGNGVSYGSLATSAGQDLDAVFIVGCAEGLCPTPRRDDGLLPDAARILADGELELRLGQLGEQHRQFLAALATAPAGSRTLLFPRGDLRGGRHLRPSRWLLDSATKLAGERVHATSFDGATPHPVEEIESYASGLLAAPEHASLEERDLAEVRRFQLSGQQPGSHPAAAAVLRGIDAQLERSGDALSEWDGNLAGCSIPTTDERPLSPTRLQTWASCGFKYFLAYVLGLGDREDPERTVRISPLDKGSGVHTILERFLEEVIDHGPPEPDQRWSADQRARLQELAGQVFDQYEEWGRTGRRVNWQIARTDLLALLDEFLDSDDSHRASTRSTPIEIELPFGMDEEEPVVLTLRDGRVLKFKGKADRVDEAPGGRMFVSDYKTGKGKEYNKIDEGDPVKGGTTLQLGLYAEAARQQLGASEVDAHYWMVNPEAGHARHGYAWSDERRQRMLDVLEIIVDGIEQGMFAATPGDWNNWMGTHEECKYCDFDLVCLAERGEQAAMKQNSVEVRLRDGLVQEADDD